jgi:hypothetical protein
MSAVSATAVVLQPDFDRSVLGRAAANDVWIRASSVGRPQRLGREEDSEKRTGRLVMMAS